MGLSNPGSFLLWRLGCLCMERRFDFMQRMLMTSRFQFYTRCRRSPEGSLSIIPYTRCRVSSRTSSTGSRSNSTVLQSNRQRLFKGAGTVALVCAIQTGSRLCAECAASHNRPTANKPDEPEDDFEKLLERYGPFTGEITMGTIAGLTSGYAMKKIGKAAAFFIGVAFISAQTLTYLGYLDVNWRKVERELLRMVDQDGDDKITKKDLLHLWKKVKAVLTYELPSVAGFATGFAVGFYKG